LKGKLVPEEQWEGVLVDVVHSIRSLYITQCRIKTPNSKRHK